jgi:hypothetical protein
MNRCILIAIWLIPFLTKAQWTEDFSDQEFHQNPAWVGDLDQFLVDSTGRLQLHGDIQIGEALLHTSSAIQVNAEWTFDLVLLFNPSINNFVEIDLLTLNPALPMEERIFLKIGGNSEDRIQLYYELAGQKQHILESAADVLDLNKVDLKIRVTRSDSLWILRSRDQGDSLWVDHGSGVFDEFFPGNLFGWRCYFTSSRRDKFFLDNILVHGDPHLEPPRHRLEDWYAYSRDSLVLKFNEELPPGINPLLYWNGDILLAEVIGTGEEMHINLHDMLEGSSGRLDWSFQDRWRNLIEGSCLIHFQKPTYRQLRFTEVLYDPNPRVDKQFPEFIELYNASPFSVQLKGYSICVNQHCRSLPHFRLSADHYMILASDSLPYSLPEASHFFDISLPALPNKGACLRILNEKAQVLDRMIYDPNFHDDPNKTDGGWSIESRYEKYGCQDRFSWRSSLGPKGASPGWNEDGVGHSPSLPVWGYTELLEDDLVLLHANKELFINDNDSLDPAHKYLADLPKEGMLFHYEDSAQNWLYPQWYDCMGRPFETPENISIDTGFVGKGDITVSEIMFAPEEDHPEYLEIENQSSRPVDLSRLGIAKIDTVFGVLLQLQFLTDDRLLLPPGRLLILTRDQEEMKRRYALCDSILILEVNIPALNNDKACLAILKRNLDILETFCYDADWHHPYLDEENGVSLERLSPLLSATSPDAWHSASYLQKRSPNCLNSQKLERSGDGTGLFLEFDEFSPNNDGFRDVLPIQWKSDQYGGQLEIKILDRFGHEVLEIQEWTLIGHESIFYWDGSIRNGQIAPHGVYLIVGLYRDRSGHQESIVRPCVLRD